MSIAAILLTLTANSAPVAAQIGTSQPRPSAQTRIATSASASARILRPAIIRFDGKTAPSTATKSNPKPQRRVERSGNQRATVWIEFS
ncbi:MAG: hypothetical protein ABJ242_01390 [Marinomonas sp.]